MMCAKFGTIVTANNDLATGGRDLWITLYNVHPESNSLWTTANGFKFKRVNFKLRLTNLFDYQLPCS